MKSPFLITLKRDQIYGEDWIRPLGTPAIGNAVQERPPAHEKVRFRRHEIGDLARLPSALAARSPKRGRWQGNRRWLWWLTLVPTGVVLALLLFVVAFSNSLGGETLRVQAERAISSLAGKPLEVSFGSTGLGFDDFSLLSVRIKDARISDPDNGGAVFEAGDLSFGLRALPLLTGNVRLGGARLSNSRIDLSNANAGGGTHLDAIFDERGLVDPELMEEQFFRAGRMLFEALDGGISDTLELRSVTIVFGEEPSEALFIEAARLDRSEPTAIKAEADIVMGGRQLRLEVSATRPTLGGEVTAIKMAIFLHEDHDKELPSAIMPGSGRIAVSGTRDGEGDARLTINARLTDIALADTDTQYDRFNILLSAYSGSGLNKLEISDFRVSTGQSAWRFHGALGAMPTELTELAEPAYRFELVSDGSHLAPRGSLEPSIDVLARLAGTINADGRRVSLDELAVRTTSGEARGRAAFNFETWNSPGLELELWVADLPVGQTKQLWPWFAAPGARSWVQQNLFGGSVTEGWLRVALEPGRLLNEVPTLPGEVMGNFAVERVRFDVAGRIPPVREGIGRVVFDGSIVDISLDSGTVFLGSGRTVAANNGTFHIDASSDKQLIGVLDIDVAGEAAAIMELASYDPINASGYLDLTPEDLKGQVSGKIVADIPLEADVSRDELAWMVVLDYESLSLAKPFQDYRISDAKGSILVEPSRVVIDAEARLDDMPARVYLVEPLDGSQTNRQQEVSLRFDNSTRDRLAPGLASFLSGSAAVEMRSSEAGRHEIGVDLGASRLSVPWAGWTKGSGIPAKASFVMENAGAQTVLDNFALSGETFAVHGSLALAAGELQNARFYDVRLNRGDEFSVDIVRQGPGYAIDISGKSLDARSLVRHLTEEGEAGVGSVDGVPIKLEMRMDQIVGFHGEVLRNVRLTYGGTGAQIDSLFFSAITASGHPVHFRHDTVDGSRNITMQSTDAGAVVRFLDLYERMEGGTIELALSGRTDGPLSGHVDARDFWLVNEPRLGSLVSTPPQGSDRSLNQAVRGQVDVTRVRFDRGFAQIGKGPGYLSIGNGVLRGAQIGTTFRGVLYDANGNMDITGTFLPAYGLNRIFGEIPLVGQILGNGRDGGLIGVTYRLAGKAGEPQLQVNPLSAVAPGIFRSVFEFN